MKYGPKCYREAVVEETEVDVSDGILTKTLLIKCPFCFTEYREEISEELNR